MNAKRLIALLALICLLLAALTPGFAEEMGAEESPVIEEETLAADLVESDVDLPAPDAEAGDILGCVSDPGEAEVALDNGAPEASLAEANQSVAK